MVAVAAALGLGFGLSVATLDETRVIKAVADEHVAAGGRAEDCTARPGAAPVWVVVRCGEGAEARVVAFNRLGFRVATATVSNGPGA